MIKLTKLNGQEIYINPDLMGNMEAQPHTIIHMTTGERIIVKEGTAQVADLIISYKRKIYLENKSV
ncbi:MAG TPA: endoflagellar protein [Elusimicrobia bacterium]|nr:MAG: endoflagellar protein [Elusimicrobia bacterium RIFOXYA12_FULL_49_49]OGS06256.1 MAG: endoflagellar protein [Elusimicrobia bacterium RIFOXYA1_FULL_47_7]OGS09249.1 MAG: endoflagellar protein [Elusimicrobia bacterium RIFOXYB1_FULL_48_9]OGS14631.1 MAG: endoflagellar protein [Elusimicrobia bacterium RIFOXYA2_FULL_47_53]OGS25716.1 MAG: endoflagellar protein [Elusimicrobia bacterium RIFOXYB12_FULL_50_12]OGS31722.1 MAG: endoflagellar protein [Elusimicrobia bacterium RIFOXYB2_FULL_46_23]HBU6975